MAFASKTMMRVLVDYSTNGASTMIFASETDDDPRNEYSSHANPGADLINEVLDKIKANNAPPNDAINLCIANDTFIVSASACAAGAGAGAMAKAIGLLPADQGTAAAKPRSSKPKPAPAKHAKHRAFKNAASKKSATKKRVVAKATAKKSRR